MIKGVSVSTQKRAQKLSLINLFF